MTYTKTSKELVVKALDLNQQGKTNLEIAKELNVSDATVCAWLTKLKKMGVQVRKTSNYITSRVDWKALADELK